MGSRVFNLNAITHGLLMILLAAGLAGCGRQMNRYRSPVERGEILIELQDGQRLYVAEAQEEADRLWVRFPGHTVSWIPSDQVTEMPPANAQSPGFLEAYLNRPMGCEPAHWLESESWQLMEALRGENVRTRIGSYDRPAPEKKRAVEADQDLKNIRFSDLRYYPKKRTRPALLQVLGQDLEKVLSKEKGLLDLTKYLPIATDIDLELAVELAEADLRQATGKTRKRKTVICLELYLLADETDKIKDFLDDPYDWVPEYRVPALAALLKANAGKGADSEFRTAYGHLLTGNVKAFRKKQVGVTASGEESPFGHLALDQSVKAGSYEGLIGTLKTKFTVREFAFLERMAVFTNEEVISDIEVLSEVFGAMSSPVADRVLYLIEQRRYCGTGIPVRNLLWTGIYVKGRDAVRAAPVFHLAQKTAGMNFTGQYWGKGAIQAQFGVESAGYFLECFEEHKKLVKRPPYRQAADGMTAFAYQLAINSPDSSKARGYASMAFQNRRKVLSNPADTGPLVDFLRTVATSSKSSRGDIASAVFFLGAIEAYEHRDVAAAIGEYEKLITGEYSGVKSVMRGADRICLLARRYPLKTPQIRRKILSFKTQNLITDEQFMQLSERHPKIFGEGKHD